MGWGGQGEGSTPWLLPAALMTLWMVGALHGLKQEAGVGLVVSGGRVWGPPTSVTAGGNLPGWRGCREAWRADVGVEGRGGLLRSLLCL